MKTTNSPCLAWSAVSFVALAVLVGQAPAQADPLPYGPDTCIQGYVWREAIPNDHVCVTPAVRDRIQQENSTVAERRDPTGAYGSNTCKQGYVWREAFDGDVVCVTPDIRSATKADNAQAASRVQKPQSQANRTTITGDVDIYAQPGGQGKPYGMVSKGTQVEVKVRQDDRWVKIAGPNVPGGSGWVWGDYVGS